MIITATINRKKRTHQGWLWVKIEATAPKLKNEDHYTCNKQTDHGMTNMIIWPGITMA